MHCIQLTLCRLQLLAEGKVCFEQLPSVPDSDLATGATCLCSPDPARVGVGEHYRELLVATVTGMSVRVVRYCSETC